MGTAIVVFTRDLRVRDHPALATAVRENDRVVPLFVLDDRILATRQGAPNRLGFFLDALGDLDESLRSRGGALVVRRGDWVDEVLRIAREVDASSIHVSDDVSGLARRRLDRLDAACGPARIGFHRHPGITVVPADDLAPGAGSRNGAGEQTNEYKVFTPYFRRWKEAPWRSIVEAPGRVTLPDGLDPGRVPDLGEITKAARSPDVPAGGETAGLERLGRWSRSGLADYDRRHDDLAGDATSRISAYLHAGCVSPLEVASRLRHRNGGAAFVRQLGWRDFYHQVLAARPDAAHQDYRARGDRWYADDETLAAWKEGRTGYPIVDAGMRQLAREGFMHNRARMIVASFLTKDLYLDWRSGADHFMELLVDGDLANNQMNWQWVAGTGNDTNRFRVFNPTRQAERFDPDGTYIRRYVAELAELAPAATIDPDARTRAAVGYPEPLVDHRTAVDAYRARVQA